MIVLAIGVMLAAGAGALETAVVRHDPLVQSDVVQHYAYRALEAGMNTYLQTVNADPNEITCKSTSPTTGQCVNYRYGTWHQVTGTTGSGIVPEWYEWGDPTFCFTVACTRVSSSTTPLLYVKEPVYGAAGYRTHYMYQTSTMDLRPENGFLNHVWWSNYESVDPSAPNGSYSTCSYGLTAPPPQCNPVWFAKTTEVYGPIFTNDAMYVTHDPTLGPVETADPTCLFVTEQYGCFTGPTPRVVKQTSTAAKHDQHGVPREPMPTSDTKLLTVASEPQTGGCVYTGPTTITFEKTDKMEVWSPETTPTSRCKPLTTGTEVSVPNGKNGNGVIYVKTQTTPSKCLANANPFVTGGTDAQWGRKTVTYRTTFFGYTYTQQVHWSNYLGATTAPNCEGDVFVSDAQTATAGAITGQLTVAAKNDVVITGNLEYTKSNCGTTFNSTKTGPCRLNESSENDVLGLVATNYVEVSHPVTPTDNAVLTPCRSTQLGKPTAATCNPIQPSVSSHLTIDAAILALKNSFAVNNWTTGPHEGTLYVYGSIDQDWRGAVGLVTGIGYTKDYDWDSRISTIAPPYYLQPGTPSWGVASSSVIISTTSRKLGIQPPTT